MANPENEKPQLYVTVSTDKQRGIQHMEALYEDRNGILLPKRFSSQNHDQPLTYQQISTINGKSQYSSNTVKSGDAKKHNPQFNKDDILEPSSGRKHFGGDDSLTDKYATKEELKTLDTKLSGQFETLMAKMDGKFNTMNAKTDGKFDELNATITGSFKSAKAETESRFSKLEAIQSKWFIGTAIAIVGLVVALLKFF